MNLRIMYTIHHHQHLSRCSDSWKYKYIELSDEIKLVTLWTYLNHHSC